MPGKSIRFQMFARGQLIENAHGSGTHVGDFLRYLREQGHHTDYVELLPEATPGNVPIGAIATIVTMLKRVYLRLPAPVINNYRSVKRRVLPSRISAEPPRQELLWDRLISPSEIHQAARHIVRWQPDVVIADYAWLADVFAAIPVNIHAVRVIFTHDVLHQRIEALANAGLSAGHSPWTSTSEGAELSKAEILLAVQPADAKTLKQLAPACEVVSLPMSVRPHDLAGPGVAGRCLFVGSMAEPNVDGIVWFLSEIWPTVAARAPNSSLHICGHVCERLISTDERVVLRGVVDDLTKEYSAAQVVVVPLRLGSGLKIKLIEALAYGRACVSTPIGVQGYPDLEDNGVLVADSAGSFIDAVCNLLADEGLRARVEAHAIRYGRSRFSPVTAYQPFVECVEAMLSQTRDRTGVANRPAGRPGT